MTQVATTQNTSFARLIVTTQDYENYNHTGAGAPRWKAKGGIDCCVAVLSVDEAARGEDYLEATYVRPVLGEIEVDCDMFTRQVINWFLLWNGELTWFERSQAEYELEIGFATRAVGAGGDGPWCPVSAKAVIDQARAGYQAAAGRAPRASLADQAEDWDDARFAA